MDFLKKTVFISLVISTTLFGDFKSSVEKVKTITCDVYTNSIDCIKDGTEDSIEYLKEF